ncbi:MAG: vWA domain-containing protein [Candidatus Promineifilaceae bacterium]
MTIVWDEHGNLLPNVLHFGRLLRALGLKISAGQLSDLARALTLIDITSRADFYYTSRGLLVTNPHDFERFDQAFDLFWTGMQRWLLSLGQTRHMRPAEQDEQDLPAPDPILAPGQEESQENGDKEEDASPEPADDIETSALYSPVELLHHKNFADFTEEEKRIVREAMGKLIWQFSERQTRRQRRTTKRARYIDLRGAIRANTGNGGEIVQLRWRRRKTKPRPLIVLCDISGSMDSYSRLFLHFIHSLSQDIRHVEAFAFGTRLTHLTPALRHSDVDTAVDKISDLVVDWSGGTRIGESLRTFNYRWSRRVLGWGATAIIISDGWERGDLDLLDREMDRLRRSVHRLLWLNPLAGSPGYQPLVGGIKTVLPYCDEFLPLHNLNSLEQVVSRLGAVAL